MKTTVEVHSVLYSTVPSQLLSGSHVPNVNFCAGITVNKQGNYTIRHKGCHNDCTVNSKTMVFQRVRQECCILELLGYHFDISQKC